MLTTLFYHVIYLFSYTCMSIFKLVVDIISFIETLDYKWLSVKNYLAIKIGCITMFAEF